MDETGPAVTARRRRRPEPTPTQRALGLLVRREHSQRELTRKLVARGVSTEEAAVAVAALEAAGWQDDGRFAESLVRNRASAGYGPVRIQAELAMHGLGRDAIDAAMAAFDGDWVQVARELVQRRIGQLEGGAPQRKATELLLRRGFSVADARRVTRFDPTDGE